MPAHDTDEPSVAVAEPSPEATTDEKATQENQGTRARVLIVDDEQSILSALKRLLRREPYEILTAGGADEALSVMEKEPVSLIITDYRMPNMTGTELLSVVQRRWPDTIRIVLSGYSEVKAIIAAINEGAVYKFLTKPWNDEEIRLHIRRALEQHALEGDNLRMANEIQQQNERLRELNEQLDQRVRDASAGLTHAQELVEELPVGVLMIDVTGMVVGSNAEAARLLSEGGGYFFGRPAASILPDELKDVVGTQRDKPAAGAYTHDDRRLQWRIKFLQAGGRFRGCVVILWEDVT